MIHATAPPWLLVLGERTGLAGDAGPEAAWTLTICRTARGVAAVLDKLSRRQRCTLPDP